MGTPEPNQYAMEIWKYAPPIITIIGTIGHILTIIAVNGSKRKSSSFSVYLTMLAVVDTLTLYEQAIVSWLHYTFDIILREYGQVLCKLNYFLGFLLTHLSSWIVMTLTLERTVCLFFPHKFGALPKPKVGWIVIASVFVFLFALDCHVIYGREIVSTERGNICGFVDNNYKQFFYTYWSKIHFVVYFALPVTIIILGNSAIVFQVYRSSSSTRGSTSSDLLRKRRRQVFLITLLISIAFVCLVSPLPLLFFFAPVDARQLTATIFLNMLYINHGINFFLYVLSGSRFREDLRLSFRRLCCKDVEPEVLPTLSSNVPM